MAFNINFGQAVISNAQKDRQLDLEQQRINNQREAAAASAANQASATFWSRVNAEEANANRKKELELREEKQDQELSWDDAVKKQELAEKEARIENLKKLSAKYDAAFESDKAKAEEEVAQAKERQNLLNSELGTLYLSAYQRGGRVSPSQLQAFNAETGSQYDFIGNTMTIPMRDGTVKTETIGDGKSFFMGQFQRDAKGDIVYGQDGTPVTQMVEMPRQMQRALLSSAYGKAYVDGSDRFAVEEKRQEGMNYRADQRAGTQDKILELRRAELEERTAKRLQTAHSAEEKNRILEESKKAELQLRNEELEAKYAQMGLQYGDGSVRRKASDNVQKKLEKSETPVKVEENPSGDGVQSDKGTIKPSDNSGDETSKQEPPNGEYTKVKDGVSYHWGKSRNGEWGYFPDKKK